MEKIVLLMTVAAVLTASAAELKKETFPNDVSVFKQEGRWRQEGGDKIAVTETVPASDHAFGGSMLRITRKGMLEKFDRIRLETPIRICEPGCAYQVSGWFKAEKTGLMQIQLTSIWQPNMKQYFVSKNFQVTPEWQKITIKFDVPEATPDSTVSTKKFYVTFGLFQKNLDTLCVKDLTWEKL